MTAAERANKRMKKWLIFWQNVATVSIVGNVILTIIIIVLVTKI